MTLTVSRGCVRRSSPMTAGSSPATMAAKPPIRTSPIVGSSSASISVTPCRSSSKAAMLRRKQHLPVGRRYGAVPVPVEQPSTDLGFEVADRLGDHRRRHCEIRQRP